MKLFDTPEQYVVRVLLSMFALNFKIVFMVCLRFLHIRFKKIEASVHEH